MKEAWKFRGVGGGGVRKGGSKDETRKRTPGGWNKVRGQFGTGLHGKISADRRPRAGLKGKSKFRKDCVTFRSIASPASVCVDRPAQVGSRGLDLGERESWCPMDESIEIADSKRESNNNEHLTQVSGTLGSLC